MNAEPVELVRLLIQKALECVREAREHLRHRRIAERGMKIGDAYACIAELLRSLKPEVEPEMVARLQKLYIYMQQRLMDANREQADAPLAEVRDLLNTLNEAWTGVSAQLAAPREMPEMRAPREMERESMYGQVVMA